MDVLFGNPSNMQIRVITYAVCYMYTYMFVESYGKNNATILDLMICDRSM